MADVFCRGSRRRVKALFHDLWCNDDVAKYKLGAGVVDGKYQFLEQGILSPAERLNGQPQAAAERRETAIAS